MRNESLTPEAVPDSLIGLSRRFAGDLAARRRDAGRRYGRHVTYLRLSITDRCDFRCGYCMAEEMTFLPRAQVLTLEECLRIAGTFVDLGVTKVRVTGGEPLVRHNAVWLLEQSPACRA
jgi:cyclic pyranopterin phosphate synthase